MLCLVVWYPGERRALSETATILFFLLNGYLKQDFLKQMPRAK